MGRSLCRPCACVQEVDRRREDRTASGCELGRPCSEREEDGQGITGRNQIKKELTQELGMVSTSFGAQKTRPARCDELARVSEKLTQALELKAGRPLCVCVCVCGRRTMPAGAPELLR